MDVKGDKRELTVDRDIQPPDISGGRIYSFDLSWKSENICIADVIHLKHALIEEMPLIYISSNNSDSQIILGL